MNIEFKNGASVSRMWGDDGTELMAGFQYDGDALMFAKAKAEQDARAELNTYYIVTSHYSGKVHVVRYPDPKAKAA